MTRFQRASDEKGAALTSAVLEAVRIYHTFRLRFT